MCSKKKMWHKYKKKKCAIFFVTNNFPIQLYSLAASMILDSFLTYSFAFLDIEMKQIICSNAKTT